MTTVRGPYAAWASWLDAFAAGEDLPSAHLAPLDEAMGPEMIQRVFARVRTSFLARLDRWVTQFERDQAHAASADALGKLLVEARRRLGPLARFTRMPQFDQETRIELGKALTQSISTTEDSLRRSARQNPLIERQLLGVISSISLLHGLTAAATQDVLPARPAPLDSHPPRRRVIG